MPESNWKAFEIEAELEKLEASAKPYREFLRVPSLSCGLYRLPVGSADLQGPHDEDEVYFVLRGKARLRVDDQNVVAEPGSVLYVRATSDHSFFEIEEDLTLLVFFGSGGPLEEDL